MRGLWKHQGEKDAAYRRATARVGTTMLIMLALFYGLNGVADWLSEVLLIRADAVTNAVVYELLDDGAYLLSFMLPVLFLRIMTPASERAIMPTSPRLPRRLWLLLPAGLAIIYVAATTNTLILKWLGVSSSSSGFQLIEGMEAYEGVLLYLASVLVPAFCEEFLFRGAVLGTLLPYGKTTAVLGSALLFGLMHQNAEQFLYTSVAGVVLAWLVLESGSIWSSVLLHLFNNLFAIIQSILYRQMGEAAVLLNCVIELLVIGGGLLCLVYLVAHERYNGGTLRGGGQRPDHPVRGFFTLPMLLYTVLCAGQMVLMIILVKHLGI